MCGLISDGLHVHPEMVGLAFRMLGPDRLCLVTDAIAATGMVEGEYRLAPRTVYVEDGVPKLGSGAIAGSVLTMREAFKNILAFTGCTVPEAARMASTSPARLVGEGRRRPPRPGLRRRRDGPGPRPLRRGRLAFRRASLLPGGRMRRVRCRNGRVYRETNLPGDVEAVVNAANARLGQGRAAGAITARRTGARRRSCCSAP